MPAFASPLEPGTDTFISTERWVWICVFVIWAPTACAGTDYLSPDLEPPAISCEAPVVSAATRIAVGSNFRAFVHRGRFDDREIHYAYGPAAAVPLAELLRSCFAELELAEIAEPRIGVSEVFETAEPGSSIAVAGVVRFARASQNLDRSTITAHLSLELELMTRDGESFMIDGEGQGSARSFPSRSVRKAGVHALRGALLSLRDELTRWSGLLDDAESR